MVLVATDTPENVDLLDVVNFMQFVFGGGKTANLETSASPQPVVARGQSRVNRAESTYGVPVPAQPSAPAPPTTVVFEKTGLGGEGMPALEGQDYVTALLSAMERVNDPSASADPNAVFSMGTPMFSAPASPNMLKRAESTVGVQEPAAAPTTTAAAAQPTTTAAAAIPRVLVVGCPSMLAASAIASSGQYSVALVLTINSVDAFPQMAKLQELLKGTGGKKQETKKPDPRDKKKGEPGKPIVAANIAARLKTELPGTVEITEFRTFDIGNAALAEAIVTDATQVLKNVESSFLEFVGWSQSRQLAVVTPVPSDFSLLAWTKLRAKQDLAKVDLATTVCHSATKLVAGRTDGWSILTEVQESLVNQLDVRETQSGAGNRVVQLVDMNLHEQQVQQREALIRKIQQMRIDQATSDSGAADGGPSPSVLSAPTPAGKKSEKPAVKTGKESQSLGASPLPPDSTSPVSLEVPPPDPLPTIGYPFIVEQKRADISETSEQDAKWLVRQFVKRSLGRLDSDSDANKQLADLLDDSPSAAKRSTTTAPDGNESPLPPLLELSLRDLYRREPVSVENKSNDSNDEASAGEKQLPSGFTSFPTRSKILYRAVQTHPELELKETEPSIRNALLKKIEQTHTSREKSFALLQTLADQTLHEHFPESAVPLRAHQYVENLDKMTAEERILQYVEHHGEDVTRVLRVDMHEDDGLQSSSSAQKAATSNAVLIAAVDVPQSRQKTVVNDFHVSGVPTYAQYKLWAHAPDGDVRKSVLAKESFVGTAAKGSTVFVSDTTHVVFPYDGSVVRVSDVPLSGSRSVSYAKADLKAALHCSVIPAANPLTEGPGSKRRFTTTFDDGVVFTASQPDVAPRPQTSPPQPTVLPAAPPAASSGANLAVPSLLSGTSSFQATPRQGAQQQQASTDAARTQTPLNSQNPSPVSLIQLSTPASGALPAPTKQPVPFVFEPVIPASTTITVSKNHFIASVDELKGNVTFQFLKRDARKGLVYGLDSTTSTLSTAIEFEVARTIDNFTGAVHRFFASGAQQSLFADGSVAARLSPSAPWLFTAVDGSRYVKDAADTSSLGGSISKSKSAVDREASCRVQSRDDGVVIADYFSPPSTEGHTRVVAHADGTVIVSFLGAQSSSSTVLDNLYAEVSSLSTFGMCTYVIETPRAPRVFLFASTGPLNSFYVQLGDGSVLERHVMPPQTHESSAYMQTVFCRGSESTLRYNHDCALMFVEPHDVHIAATNPQQQTRSATLSGSTSAVAMRQQNSSFQNGASGAARGGSQNMNSIAICEAIPVFDLALGELRLVDREKYVTTVTGIFDFSLPSATATLEKSSVMELLLAMLPSGYHTHVRSKKQLEKLGEQQTHNNDDDYGSDGDPFPTLVDRLRLLAQTFVVDNRLIQQESLRRPHAALDSTKTGATATGVPKAANDVQEDQDAMVRLLSKNARPLVLAELSGAARFEQLMCAADLAAFLKATNNKQWTVASSICSGEPGVEQIAFYRAAGAALLMPFEGTTLEGPNIPWLPKSLQPPRRFVSPPPHASSRVASAASPAASVMADGFVVPKTAPDFPLCGALRVLLRYSPLSHAVRSALLASHIDDQVRYAKMNMYAKSLQDAIGKESDEVVAGVEELWSRHGTLLSSVSASNLPQQPTEEPSPVRPGGNQQASIPAPTSGIDSALVPPTRSAPAPGQAITVTEEHPVTFLPTSADFGSLVPGFAYHMPVTVKNNTSYTLLFEIFNPPPHNHFGSLTPSFVSVKTHRFLLSPFGESVVNVLATLAPDAVKSVMTRSDDGLFDECLRLECHALKTMFRLHVTGKCNFAPNAKQALLTTVNILGAAR